MYLTTQNIRAPFIGALFLLMVVTNIIGMESELKQRLLPSNVPSLIELQLLEDCGICYEETNVMLIPCKMGEKHPKICRTCLNGCYEVCPYCRGALIIEKNNINNNTEKSTIENMCLGIGCGSLVIYVCMIINAFS